ncbi:MAG TPA: phage major capsid protein [Fimbriimonas sp.]|nr:phage major capsid protein [Fimbriimonas sp.]
MSVDQINAITQKKFIPKLYDNIFDSNVLLKKMKEGDGYDKVDGGSDLNFPLEYAQTSSAGTYSGADLLSTTDNDSFTAAVYQWKQYYANISITGIDKAKNQGDSQVIDFVKSKTQNAEKTLAQLLGDGLYSNGTDSKSLVGLRYAVANTNTIGGISQSSYSWWNCQKDSSTTTLSLAAMQAIDNSATIDNDSPTLITCTRAIYNSYWALLQPQQRFQDSKTADAGFQNLMFNGKPVVVDSKCPTSHMFFHNMKYMKIKAHKDFDMKFMPFVQPINQDIQSAKVLWYGALGYSNLRMIGALTAITG